MDSAILLSIKPYNCELIFENKKLIEIKKAKPKIKPPFKCYIYCTAGDYPFFRIVNLESTESYHITSYNKKIIGEFICDKILEIKSDYNDYHFYDISDDNLSNSYMDQYDLYLYGKGKTLYGWHISDLIVYDNPKELDEFSKAIECYRGKQKSDYVGCWDCEVAQPPKQWIYVRN